MKKILSIVMIAVLVCSALSFYGCTTYEHLGKVTKQGCFEFLLPDDWEVQDGMILGASRDEAMVLTESFDKLKKEIDEGDSGFPKFLLIEKISEYEAGDLGAYTYTDNIQPFTLGDKEWSGKRQLVQAKFGDNYVRATIKGYDWDYVFVKAVLSTLKLV